MRTSAITAAVLALSIMAGTVNANDDFSALLADLSFGDAPSLSEPSTESLTVVQEETLQDLMPLPAGMSMPGMLESTPTAPECRCRRRHASARSSSRADGSRSCFGSSVRRLTWMPPLQSRKPRPYPPRRLAICMHGNNCETGACGGYETTAYCRPRGMVNLPSSTFHQYFRSHPCYTNVWDGYGIYCGSHHKHLHGECDCFKQSGCGACDGHGKCDGCGN